MRGNQKFFQILLCFILIAGIPYGSMAADRNPSPPLIKGVISGDGPLPVPVIPPGKNGLLSGMTPGKYSVPSGWSLVRAQDFEGSQPEDELWALFGTAVTTTLPHMGSKSIGGTYTSDQSYVGWTLQGSAIGSYSELYISFYEYIDASARFNDEFWLMRLESETTPWEEIILVWFWGTNANGEMAYNSANASLHLAPQGDYSDRYYLKFDAPNSGSWNQWEIHIIPTVGTNTASIYVYKNGNLYGSATNKTFNPNTNMNGAKLDIGGIYSLGCWANTISGGEAWPPSTCASDINLPEGCTSGPGKGQNIGACYPGDKYSPAYCGSFAQPRCYPKQPALSSFKRFFDDIIIMKR